MCDKNPFKYRGYFYDWQTGLYYLQSRYYDPSTGRFISVDSFEYADPETVDGLNLYAYCGNNPVMYIDPTGHWVIGLLLAALIGGISAGVVAYNRGLGLRGIILSFLGGAIMGAAIAASFALGGMAFGTSISKAIEYWGLAIYIGISASGVNYILQSAAYEQPADLMQLLGSSISGFFETNISFFAGALAARLGFYDMAKKANPNIVDNLMKKPFEAIVRSLVFSVPSAGIRMIFKYFFNKRWELIF